MARNWIYITYCCDAEDREPNRFHTFLLFRTTLHFSYALLHENTWDFYGAYVCEVLYGYVIWLQCILITNNFTLLESRKYFISFKIFMRTHITFKYIDALTQRQKMIMLIDLHWNNEKKPSLWNVTFKQCFLRGSGVI